MVSRTEKEVAMVSAVSEVLRLRKEKGAMTPEEMMQDLTKFLKYTRGEEPKVLGVAAASKALSMMHKNPAMSDKEVMGQMVRDFDSIIDQVETEMM